ncbi:MAG TPA: globin domain-containing protein [Nocardioidaceae bacterium]|nr:globin domain-containing protein [Nocardioidaceae bacterium]
MLSDESARVVRATIPAVTTRGADITARFYDTMLAGRPELLNLFNRGNQANGEQRRALAASVVAYAEHLIGDSQTSFQPVLDRIANKHVSLGVRPDQYTIVGRYLLGAVAEVLGEAVTPEVAAAWDEVYWLFATQLVAAEARMYQRAGVDPTVPWQPWKVLDKIHEAHDVISLVLQPADGARLPEFLPGQYLTVAVELPDGTRQPRQYTISHGPGRDDIRLTVRRQRGTGGAPDGEVSSYLHDQVRPGDTLDLSAPAGDVTLPEGPDPLVLVSAGVGITPVAAMLDHIGSTEPERPVIVAHADRSPATHALRGQIEAGGSRLSSFEQFLWYEEHAATPALRGLLDPAVIPVPDKSKVFMCGPLVFMRDVRSNLLRRGVAAGDITYEVFGPDLWTAATGA